MRKLIALVLGGSLASMAPLASCGRDLDTSRHHGQAGEENCTRTSCFWLLSPGHPAWAALDNGVNPPAGQDTIF